MFDPVINSDLFLFKTRTKSQCIHLLDFRLSNFSLNLDISAFWQILICSYFKQNLQNSNTYIFLTADSLATKFRYAGFLRSEARKD